MAKKRNMRAASQNTNSIGARLAALRIGDRLEFNAVAAFQNVAVGNVADMDKQIRAWTIRSDKSKATIIEIGGYGAYRHPLIPQKWPSAKLA
jgi:hypothetical protein